MIPSSQYLMQNTKTFIYLQRNLFVEERKNNQLMFGTSVFHSYVHQWSCQLRYNPRLNDGWGMSDGEGMERIWAYLSPLISPLRYSTKKHRLAALDMRSLHHNEVSKTNSGDYSNYSFKNKS